MRSLPEPEQKPGTRDWRRDVSTVVRATRAQFLYGVLYPLSARNWYDAEKHRGYGDGYYMLLLAILDRVCLIGIALAATYPKFSTLLQTMGIAGLGLMLLAYLATGRFTLLLLDAVHKAELDHYDLVPYAPSQFH
jgi:hypothetical protein